jgi:PAS domain S-box-containing protein
LTDNCRLRNPIDYANLRPPGDVVVTPQSLRREAERRLSGTRAKKLVPNVASKRRLTDELVLHKLELEVQNEELRRTHVELQEANEELTDLYDHAPVAYITFGADMRIVRANVAAAALLGVERRRLLGRAFSSFLPPADADALHLLQARPLETAGRCACEVRLRSSARASRRLQLLMTVRVVHDVRTGRSRRLCHCALIDLSDLRDAQEARERALADMREAREQFDLFTRHFEDVLYIMDADERVIYVSAAYEKVWGLPSTTIEGRPGAWPQAVSPDDAALVARALGERRGGAPLDIEYRIKRPDGSLRWIHDRAFPVGGDDGSPARFVGIARDRTKQRELTETLEHAQKLEAIGTLSAGLAHDLNNVLQVIIGATSLAVDPVVPAHRAKEFIHQAHAVAIRGSELVHRITGFARRDHAPPGPLAIDAALGEACELLRPLLGDHVRLVVERRAPAAVVRAQQVQLEQILLNLAANGRDAMPAGGTFTVRTTEARGAVFVRVSDTGCGMDEETRARIFSAFFTTKGEGHGTGLGLATVRGVVEQLGGKIQVSSAIGAGTTFTIELPTCERGPQARASKANGAAPEAASGLGAKLLSKPSCRT